MVEFTASNTLENSLRIKLQAERIIVSGASGWLGKNISECLVSLLKQDFENKVLLTSNTTQQIKLSNNVKVACKPWDVNEIQNFQPTMFIHSAFVMQNPSLPINKKNFLQKNNEIIEKAKWISGLESITRIVNVSSGAASRYDSQNNDEVDLYGLIKKQAEVELSLVAENNNSHLLNLRVYSVSGNHIKMGNIFFLQSLVSALIKNEDFTVTSSSPVWRSYIDAEEMFKLVIFHSLNNRSGILNSGGFDVELRSLSKLAKNILNSTSNLILPSISKNSNANYYVSPYPKLNQSYNNLLINSSSIEEQLVKTANFLAEL